MSSERGTVIITGGTAGLGYETAVSIAKSHPKYHIVLASRTNPDGAAARIGTTTNQKNVTFQPLDLASLSAIRTFAQTYSQQNHPPIYALILNAGIQIHSGLQYSADGYEKTFAVNHLGHALLFYLLLPHCAANARVVVVASGVHDPAQKTGVPDPTYVSAEAMARPSGKGPTRGGQKRYADSKLCNVLWTYALERRLVVGGGAKERVAVNAFDPGLMPGTGLVRDAPWILRFLWLNVLPHLLWLLRKLILSGNVHTTAESGGALARLALGDDVQDVSGKYFEGMREIESSVDSRVLEKQEDLWRWTIDAVAGSEDEKREFELKG